MKDSLSFMPEGWRVPSLWMRRISCRLRLSLVPEMGQRALIFIGIATLSKKCFHPQTFGLEILILAAKAAKTKELRERDGHLSMIGVKL